MSMDFGHITSKNGKNLTFNYFDTNKDGKISQKEYEQVQRLFELEPSFDVFDRDENGTIEDSEFKDIADIKGASAMTDAQINLELIKKNLREIYNKTIAEIESAHCGKDKAQLRSGIKGELDSWYNNYFVENPDLAEIALEEVAAAFTAELNQQAELTCAKFDTVYENFEGVKEDFGKILEEYGLSEYTDVTCKGIYEAFLQLAENALEGNHNINNVRPLIEKAIKEFDVKAIAKENLKEAIFKDNNFKQHETDIENKRKEYDKYQQKYGNQPEYKELLDAVKAELDKAQKDYDNAISSINEYVDILFGDDPGKVKDFRKDWEKIELGIGGSSDNTVSGVMADDTGSASGVTAEMADVILEKLNLNELKTLSTPICILKVADVKVNYHMDNIVNALNKFALFERVNELLATSKVITEEDSALMRQFYDSHDKYEKNIGVLITREEYDTCRGAYDAISTNEQTWDEMMERYLLEDKADLLAGEIDEERLKSILQDCDYMEYAIKQIKENLPIFKSAYEKILAATDNRTIITNEFKNIKYDEVLLNIDKNAQAISFFAKAEENKEVTFQGRTYPSSKLLNMVIALAKQLYKDYYGERDSNGNLTGGFKNRLREAEAELNELLNTSDSLSDEDIAEIENKMDNLKNYIITLREDLDNYLNYSKMLRNDPDGSEYGK